MLELQLRDSFIYEVKMRRSGLIAVGCIISSLAPITLTADITEVFPPRIQTSIWGCEINRVEVIVIRQKIEVVRFQNFRDLPRLIPKVTVPVDESTQSFREVTVFVRMDFVSFIGIEV